MEQTKEEYEKAFKTLNSLLIHSPFKDDPRDYNDLKVNGSRLQQEYMDSVMMFRFLIDDYFDNSDSFKAFKLLNDTSLRAFNKDSLIGYIHTLYRNWQVSDSFYENTVKENMKLLEDKSKLLDDIHDYRHENHCMKLTVRNLCKHFGVKDEEELQQMLFNKGEKKMDEVYCIIQREVNKETGEINTRVCEKGSKDKISNSLNYCKLRSIFNQELSYYLILQENEKEAIEILKNSIIEENNLYVKIK